MVDKKQSSYEILKAGCKDIWTNLNSETLSESGSIAEEKRNLIIGKLEKSIETMITKLDPTPLTSEAKEAVKKIG